MHTTHVQKPSLQCPKHRLFEWARGTKEMIWFGEEGWRRERWERRREKISNFGISFFFLIFYFFNNYYTIVKISLIGRWPLVLTKPPKKGPIRRQFRLGHDFHKVNVLDQIRILAIWLGPLLTFTLSFKWDVRKWFSGRWNPLLFAD